MASFCLDPKHFHFRNNVDVSTGYLYKYSQLACNKMNVSKKLIDQTDFHSYIKIGFSK